MRGRYQPIGYGGEGGRKLRWGHIAVVAVLLVAIAFVLLAVFGVWDIATYFQHLFFPSSSSVKACPGVVGLAFDAAQRVYGTSAVYAYAYTYVNDLHDTCTCWRQPN